LEIKKIFIKNHMNRAIVVVCLLIIAVQSVDPLSLLAKIPNFTKERRAAKRDSTTCVSLIDDITLESIDYSCQAGIKLLL
jgi:hypothetical protein